MPLPEAEAAAPVETGQERLYRTIATALDVPSQDIDEASSPDTIGSWDSLNHLNIVMAIEGEFGISLTAEDVVRMGSVGAICHILRESGVDL
jgi:acyl carrier protein